MPAATAVVTCPHCGRRNRIASVAEGIPGCGNCHNALPWLTPRVGGEPAPASPATA